MSSEPELTGDELLAAELALGLLEGEARTAVAHRAAEEPDFARAVAAWEDRLAPLLHDLPAVQPGPEIWGRIESRLAPVATAADNVVQLRRRVNLWRGYAAGITAVAASLALVVGLGRGSEPPAVQSPATLMVATLMSDDGPTKVVAAWEARTHSLLVTPAVLTPAAGHNHELWLIPAGGKPRSLGLLRTDAPHRVTVPVAWTNEVGAEASLAVSVEPTGGSPTGQPTGPIIASGSLRQI